MSATKLPIPQTPAATRPGAQHHAAISAGQPIIGHIRISGGDGVDDPLVVNGWLRLPLTEAETADPPKAPSPTPAAFP